LAYAQANTANTTANALVALSANAYTLAQAAYTLANSVVVINASAIIIAMIFG
jgi:hypothetical protein